MTELSDNLLNLIGAHTRLKWVSRGVYGDEYAGPCPFCGGEDRFRVWPKHPDGPRWHCMGYKSGRNGCGRGGDAIAFLVEIGQITPQEAGRMRHGGDGPVVPTRRATTRQEPPLPSPVDRSPVEPPPELWQKQAGIAVNYWQGRLFSEAGRVGLDWLHERGLQDEAIRRFRLGWNDRDRWHDPAKWGLSGGHKVWAAQGIVIPWFVDGAVWCVKFRRFDDSGPMGEDKYAMIRDGVPTLFGLDLLTGKRAVVICEGELDAVLLHQAAGGLVDVTAIGAKGRRISIPSLVRLLRASAWLLALDADADREAKIWADYTPRIRRMKPLQGNDVTEFHQAGGDLRAWVQFHLEF